jgi:hypothetical protein
MLQKQIFLVLQHCRSGRLMVLFPGLADFPLASVGGAGYSFVVL